LPHRRKGSGRGKQQWQQQQKPKQMLQCHLVSCVFTVRSGDDQPGHVQCGTEADTALHHPAAQCHVHSTGNLVNAAPSLGHSLLQINSIKWKRASAVLQPNEIVNPHCMYTQSLHSSPQALYTALHRLKEVVLITDDLLRIQYANRATERLLNMRLVSGSAWAGGLFAIAVLMRFPRWTTGRDH